MDFQFAFNVVASIAGVLALFVLNMAFARIAEAKKAGTDAAAAANARAAEAEDRAAEALQVLNAFKLYVAENYTSLKRFEGFEVALFKKLDSIEQKLDGKADKP